MAGTNNLYQIKFDMFAQYCPQKKERGQYDKTPKKKILTNWEKMQDLYTQLANYCPLPLFGEAKEITDFYGLRLWCESYTAERYEYQNDLNITEICKGEDFKVIEAEITGTENWYLEDRVFIHEKLLNEIRSGLDIKSAMEKIKPDFERIKNKYKTTEIVKWLKLHRG